MPEITQFDLPNALATNYRLRQMQQAEQDQNALSAGVPMLQSDPQNAFAATAARSPRAAMQLLPVIQQMDQQKRAKVAERTEAIGRLAMSLKQYKDPAVRKAVAMSQAATLESHGVTPDQIANFDYSDQNLDMTVNSSMSVKEMIAQANADRTYEAGRQDHKDTLDSQAATRAVTMRGQNMTDARARENQKNTGYRLMTTEEKKAAGLPAEAAYQINGDGKIDRVAGNNSVRPIPSSALAGIQNNRRTLAKIDQAIAALEKNPEALGWGNYAGDAITQRIPGKAGAGGVPTRALIADIGSQKLHDRSGAAVTASESPRLMPFIPQVTDTPEAAIAKLKNLRAEYEATTDEAEAFYSPEAGYMSLPSRGGAKPGNSGGRQMNAGVIDFNDLPDN